ncbi:hypothetical protein Nisw_07600 [Candidatus Nitrosopumilus sp. SW]|uniref:hypothetical protein n=1 Tax=Candidatus Nitrosopumilus sp. SW TaxID=2508726 RepID=UPI00115329E2|nr:hypothetical protein [Candidatus Nitrosopumilus sp. SW]QDI89395.1 hypothetical protein Nisw_07600 [Candidatus Nitrosopumilus sp. SW]
MVLPIVVLIVIPIFLGITYVAPFDQPGEIQEPPIPENSGAMILYVLLMGIWVVFLLRIVILMKRGSYKITQKY